MSPELQEFYNSYQAWLDAGAPDNQPYNRRYGLCHALNRFCVDRYQGLLVVNGQRRLLQDEMTAQFMRELSEDDGYPELKGIYPFGLLTKYHDEERRACAHLNVQRQAWVRKHATNVKEPIQ